MMEPVNVQIKEGRDRRHLLLRGGERLFAVVRSRINDAHVAQTQVLTRKGSSSSDRDDHLSVSP